MPTNVPSNIFTGRYNFTPNHRKANTLNLQDPRRMSLIRIWDAMFRGARQYVEEQGFIGVHNAPEIVGVTGACENVDTLFKVDYFGKQAFLAQSDQLYLELLTPHLKKVYAEIQSFRAEDVVDNRHLCQFSLFEIEHVGDLDELQANLQGILQYAVGRVLKDCKEDLADLDVTLRHYELLQRVASAGFAMPKVPYTTAVRVLRENGFPNLVWGDDLKQDHEAKIVEVYGPCFVTHYPLPIKFFNMKENPQSQYLSEELHGVGCEFDSDRGVVVNSCDMLLPHSGESAGAAEREHQHDRIVERLKTSEMYKRLKELGVQDEDFDWYLDAHKDKDVPLHSGAGIGMARVAQFILGADDIREAVPFVLNRDNLL